MCLVLLFGIFIGTGLEAFSHDHSHDTSTDHSCVACRILETPGTGPADAAGAGHEITPEAERLSPPARCTIAGVHSPAPPSLRGPPIS